jgi:hypothetical protein
VDARLGLGQVATQFGRAMLDQLDKDFVLGLEMQIEGAEPDVRFGRDVGDSGLMVSAWIRSKRVFSRRRSKRFGTSPDCRAACPISPE